MQQKQLIVVGLFLVFVLSATANAALIDDVRVKKSQGFFGGYDDIAESHEWVFWPVKKLHVLTCMNPGVESCTWTNPPSISAIPMAEDSIANGVYSGHLEYTFSGGVTSEVDWSGTSPYNVDIYEIVTYP